MRSSELSHQVGAVVASVVGDDGGKLERKQKSFCKICTNDKTDRCQSEGRGTMARALANDSMATASFPGVRLARSVTTLAISISEQPAE